uniref:Fibronectin type-III domain-containing protein n=1 Tax=Angiostrongylus cantonensis TaxID=6313 RepID=A0A158P8T3_ANGCA
MPSSFTSEYLDAHTLRLDIPPHPAGFAYVFEYATVSTKADEWYFAGASTNPAVTFTILDPCRDYKFRVIAVIRSSHPTDHFVIYSQKAIPVQLPQFALASDQIIAEAPIFNASTDTLKVYVRWTLPRGFSDADIYGYESPALYPLQCRTPEDELPQPKIFKELFANKNIRIFTDKLLHR